MNFERKVRPEEVTELRICGLTSVVGTTAALITAGLAAGGALGSAALQSKTASSAAKSQTDAANHAADLQKQAADDSLAFSKAQYADQQKNLAPWIASGTSALDKLKAFTDSNGGAAYGPQFTEKYQAPADFAYGDFKAPSGVDESNDPGYQFRIDQAKKAVLRGAAAGGGAFTGGTLRAVEGAAQNEASDEYSKLFNRAAQTYATNFQKALTGYNTNASKNLTKFNTDFNTYQAQRGDYNTDQTNAFNRLSSLAGGGQTATNSLDTLGSNLAGENASILTGTAAKIGDLTTQAGNANAAAKVTSGNAYGGAINTLGGLFNSGSSYGSLLDLLKGRSNSLPSNGWYSPGGGGYSGTEGNV